MSPISKATLALDDPSAVAQHRERLAALRKDYDARHEYWIPQQFDDNLRALLVEGAHKPAMRFWDAYRERRFLPALEKGDLTTAREAYAQMRQAYGDPSRQDRRNREGRHRVRIGNGSARRVSRIRWMTSAVASFPASCFSFSLPAPLASTGGS